MKKILGMTMFALGFAAGLLKAVLRLGVNLAWTVVALVTLPFSGFSFLSKSGYTINGKPITSESVAEAFKSGFGPLE